MINNAVMLDLETLGNGPTSVILSIGAVRFDANGIQDKIYIPVDVQTCIDVGMVVDGSTVRWWMRQSDEARAGLFKSDGLSIQCALGKFATWLHCESMWGNGASFDNVILSNAYRMCQIHQPWHWTLDRCYRTVKNMCPNVVMERRGTHHLSVDDAESQALHLIECIKSIELVNADDDAASDRCSHQSSSCCNSVSPCRSHDGFAEVVRVTDRPLFRDTMHGLVDIWFDDASRGLDILADSHLDAMQHFISEQRTLTE